MNLPAFLKEMMGPFILRGKTHDRDAAEYDEKHVEIYNPTEQQRLRCVLKEALENVRPPSDVPRVLDFGAGTGNLTGHLLDLRAMVVAADVSSKYLERLRQKAGRMRKLETTLLNGEDLSGIASGSFDMVATYSVLHHVPDYFRIVDEFLRVVRPGGIVYIDHEVCASYWELDPDYQAYLEELGGEFSSFHLRELGSALHGEDRKPAVAHGTSSLLQWWKRLRARGASGGQRRRIRKGADLHVFADDHIMWEDIAARLRPHCDILRNDDYLVCRERAVPPPVWSAWKGRCSDMHMLIARKR